MERNILQRKFEKYFGSMGEGAYFPVTGSVVVEGKVYDLGFDEEIVKVDKVEGKRSVKVSREFTEEGVKGGFVDAYRLFREINLQIFDMPMTYFIEHRGLTDALAHEGIELVRTGTMDNEFLATFDELDGIVDRDCKVQSYRGLDYGVVMSEIEWDNPQIHYIEGNPHSLRRAEKAKERATFHKEEIKLVPISASELEVRLTHDFSPHEMRLEMPIERQLCINRKDVNHPYVVSTALTGTPDEVDEFLGKLYAAIIEAGERF